MKLPNHLLTSHWRIKAAYLVDTHQARDFSAACSMLARARARKRAERMGIDAKDFWWNRD